MIPKMVTPASDNCERWNDTGLDTDNFDDDDDDDDHDDHDDCDSFYGGFDEDEDNQPIVSWTRGDSPPTMTHHGRTITLVRRPWELHVRKNPCLHMYPLEEFNASNWEHWQHTQLNHIFKSVQNKKCLVSMRACSPGLVRYWHNPSMWMQRICALRNSRIWCAPNWKRGWHK